MLISGRSVESLLARANCDSDRFFFPAPFKTPKTTQVANQSSGSKKRKLTRTTESDPSPNKKPRKKERNGSTCTIDDASDISGSEKTPEKVRKPTRDDAFQQFQRICDNVAKVDAYTDKTAILRKMLTKGSEGGKFQDSFSNQSFVPFSLVPPSSAHLFTNLATYVRH